MVVTAPKQIVLSRVVERIQLTKFIAMSIFTPTPWQNLARKGGSKKLCRGQIKDFSTVMIKGFVIHFKNDVVLPGISKVGVALQRAWKRFVNLVMQDPGRARA